MIDTLCLQHPTLSTRFCQFSKENMTAQAARELGQARFYTPTLHLSPRARQYAYEHFWKEMSRPYTLHRDWRVFIRDYTDDIIPKSDVLDFIEDFASNAEEIEFLKTFKSWIKETNARLASIKDKEERQHLAEQINKENKDLIRKGYALLNSPKVQEIINSKMFVKNTRRKIQVLDSIGADPFIKRVLLCEDAYTAIDNTRKPLSQEIMDSLAVWTDNSPALQGIREKMNSTQPLPTGSWISWS